MAAALRARYPYLLVMSRRQTTRVIALIHDPESPPDAVVARYPAHLHIDLLPVLQGKGVGKAMMAPPPRRSSGPGGVPGVHLGVGSRNHAPSASMSTSGSSTSTRLTMS